MNGRGRMALVALVVLLIFLLGSLLSESDKRRAADQRRDRAIAELSKTNIGIVDKLTEVFTRILGNAEAIEGAEAAITRITEGLKGFVDPELVAEAIGKARVAVRQGPAGPPGPPGPSGVSAASTTTTGPSTTTTTRAATTTTTTTTRSTTSTTRCAVRIGQLLKVGCQ